MGFAQGVLASSIWAGFLAGAAGFGAQGALTLVIGTLLLLGGPVLLAVLDQTKAKPRTVGARVAHQDPLPPVP